MLRLCHEKEQVGESALFKIDENVGAEGGLSNK